MRKKSLKIPTRRDGIGGKKNFSKKYAKTVDKRGKSGIIIAVNIPDGLRKKISVGEGQKMRVSSYRQAWEAIARRYGWEWTHDKYLSARAGYPVYTCDGNAAVYVNDLRGRLELNDEHGKSVNFWIDDTAAQAAAVENLKTDTAAKMAAAHDTLTRRAVKADAAERLRRIKIATKTARRYRFFPLLGARRVTWHNVREIAARISCRYLKKQYSRGGAPYIWKLYCGLISDLFPSDAVHISTDGADVWGECVAILAEYIGLRLSDKCDFCDKNGEKLPVIYAVYRRLNAYLLRQKRRVLREIYVHDHNMQLCKMRDYERYSYNTAINMREILTEARLTDLQNRIVKMRLRGYSVKKIARKLQRQRATIYAHLNAIGVKILPILAERGTIVLYPERLYR